VLRVAGDPETDRDRDRIGLKPCAQRATEPFGDDQRVLVISAGQNERELLAAHSRGPVDLSQPEPHEIGCPAQCCVTGRMPAAVIDLLEVIEVPGDERHGHGRPSRPLKLEIEQLAKPATVQQARQRIRASGFVKAGDQLFATRAHRHDEDRRDKEAAHTHQPPRWDPARRGRRDQQCAVRQPHVGNLKRRLTPGEEIRRVQKDPQVEKHERARCLT
jgi:hypothetical protein